ncbi:MAG: hypothetical protein GX130_09950 [Candidatus Hydrogenedens sp.]|jgi:hypothetical protein|nr:hypothetical protein [Candidatus Hydrogenedens sp.]
MSLEALEEFCLDFLRQAVNPLVPVSHLYAHCLESSNYQYSFTADDLLDFLKNHSELQVFDSGTDTIGEVEEDHFLEAGILMGTRVVLKSRLPDIKELKASFKLQLLEMKKQLEQLLARAEARNKPEEVEAIKKNLAKNQSLLERFENLE